MPQSPTKRNTNSPSGGKAITPGTPFDACVGVNCFTTAGVSTVTWLDGSTSTFYFNLGNNALQITNIAAGGTSAGFLALYND